MWRSGLQLREFPEALWVPLTVLFSAIYDTVPLEGPPFKFPILTKQHTNVQIRISHDAEREQRKNNFLSCNVVIVRVTNDLSQSKCVTQMTAVIYQQILAWMLALYVFQIWTWISFDMTKLRYMPQIRNILWPLAAGQLRYTVYIYFNLARIRWVYYRIEVLIHTFATVMSFNRE